MRTLYKNNAFKIIFFIILIIIGVAIFFIFFKNKIITDNNSEQVNIYFINYMNKKIDIEKKTISKTDKKDKISLVLDEFFNVNKSNFNNSNLFKNIVIENVNIEDNLVKITLSNKYLNLEPWEDVLFRTLLVWTLTDISGIEGVTFLTDNGKQLIYNGEPLGELTRNNVIISPDMKQEEANKHVVTFYFVNKEKMRLFTEDREIEIHSDQSLEEQVINQILQGSKNAYNLINDVKLLDATTINKTCYVDLSSDFLIKLKEDDKMQELFIYSIVNTLINLSGNRIQKVQFLISSEKVNEFSDKINLSQPFEKNESLVI